MNIALLFSGQTRQIDENIFRKSLKNFIGNNTAEIYISTWETPGASMEHGYGKCQDLSTNNFSVRSYLSMLFEGFQIKAINIESYDNWKNNLKDEYKDIFISTEYSVNTKNSLAQLYQIYKSYLLCQNIKTIEYDLIFRVRLDSIFLFSFKEEYLASEKICSINFGRAYFPNRIYDIFFYGSGFAMGGICKTWEKIPLFVNDLHENGLDKRDACRLLYLSAMMNKILVESARYRYADVLRVRRSKYSFLSFVLYCGAIDAKFSSTDKWQEFFRNAMTNFGVFITVKAFLLFYIDHHLLRNIYRLMTNFIKLPRLKNDI
jgi:hypothetical protein